jgi:hypothetical protein
MPEQCPRCEANEHDHREQRNRERELSRARGRQPDETTAEDANVIGLSREVRNEKTKCHAATNLATVRRTRPVSLARASAKHDRRAAFWSTPLSL